MSVSYVELEQANPETKVFYDKATDRFEMLLNIFKVFGHTPELGTVFTDLIMAVLKDGEIDWVTKELIILKATHRNDCQYCVVQHKTLSKGVDIRALVVGEKIVAAMRRQGAPDDFRSNLHRGGSAEPIKITPEERSTAVRAAKVMGLNVCGVDMLRSNHGPVIMEVNSTPGLEGVEKATGKDIAGAIIEFIEKNAKPNRTKTRGRGCGNDRPVQDRWDRIPARAEGIGRSADRRHLDPCPGDHADRCHLRTAGRSEVVGLRRSSRGRDQWRRDYPPGVAPAGVEAFARNPNRGSGRQCVRIHVPVALLAGPAGPQSVISGPRQGVIGRTARAHIPQRDRC